MCLMEIVSSQRIWTLLISITNRCTLYFDLVHVKLWIKLQDTLSKIKFYTDNAYLKKARNYY